MSSRVLIDVEGDVEVKASGVDPNRRIVNREDVEGIGAGAGAAIAVVDREGEVDGASEVFSRVKGEGAIAVIG